MQPTLWERVGVFLSDRTLDNGFMRADRLLGKLPWLTAEPTRPGRGLVQIQTETVVPASLEDTFAFFSEAGNLERLTPPWLNFRIRTPLPLVMREGLEIEYQIVLRGLPIPWRTRIEIWEPAVRFVDLQIVGPYRWWRHEHRFESTPAGTRVIDRVEFVPRFRWFTSRFVQRDVKRIFAFRLVTLKQLFSDARVAGNQRG